MGVDAVEPDVVVSKDGVLVVRHENEIGSTTDVAKHPRFAERRTTKTVEHERLTGWFTEDFTWDELATLRARERLPALRPDSAAHDDTEPILRLRDLLDLVRAASAAHGREIGVVLEIKHATSFDSVGFDVAALVEEELRAAGWADAASPLVIESFESTVLAALRERGVPATYVYLIEAEGAAFDLTSRLGSAAPTYADTVTPRGLDALVGEIDGISVDKHLILAPDAAGRAAGPSRIVADAHERGLQAFTWTCRPENAFLIPSLRSAEGDAAFGAWRDEWRIIRDSGVDGVFADHPDLAVEFFRD